MELLLGVKTDPIEYRFSFDWFFRLLAEEGIGLVQLGSFFELYQLPDVWFERLRRQAEDHGVRIASVFTAHRELGGFFIDEPGWETVARENFERLIEVAALVGAESVGSNPGSVPRDRMGTKPQGTACYLRHLKELTHYAFERGVPWLTIEPMSCLAEPPTLPEEIAAMGAEMAAYRAAHPNTARVGFCTDIAHGYADSGGAVRHDHLALFDATLPHLYEIHLKNTDARYCSTFGFSSAEREKGVVDVAAIRDRLLVARNLPVQRVIGYLEIGGPKLGRDYSDGCLAEQLRASLPYLREAWLGRTATPFAALRDVPPSHVRVSPSIMCADLCHLETGVRKLEAAGADMLHIDVADGHFVPNLLLGLDVIRGLRTKTALPLDVHLMVDNPDPYIEPLAEIGVEWVAVHAEACTHLDRTLTEIARRGMTAGVALNPSTPLSSLEYVVERLGFVLLMTVNPGFAGQKLVASAIRKIADCRRWLAERGCQAPIAVDGNVSFEHIPNMVAAGADVLVAGTSSWFHRGGSLSENVRKTQEAIAAGWTRRSKQ